MGGGGGCLVCARGARRKLGCEVGALNIGETASNLKLVYDEWDYNSSKPQSPRYKKWMKSHLARGHAIVWLVMCKGDDVCPYRGACPNGGSFGHVEPVWGLFSNHPLDDPEVYDDDWVVHSSDQVRASLLITRRALPPEAHTDTPRGMGGGGGQARGAVPAAPHDVPTVL